MKRQHAFVVLLITCCAACTTGTPAAPAASAAPDPPLPGSDRDEHGCIPSAGYSWCARTDRCVRPWELAREQGFEQTRDAFEKYCEKPAE
jgi:hypothetical protein